MAQNRVLLFIATCVLAGCAQPSALISTVPPPDLNGPKVTAPPAPTYARSTPPPKALPSNPPAAVGGVPRGWAPAGAARPWRWIVIHHSATPSGGASAFDRMHRAKGWDELGYHWVIGNGTDTPDGQIEIGSRWSKQKWGAHAKTPDNRFNDYGIGICLVGNFDKDRPTAAQMRSLARLVAYLMKTYQITPDRVIGHGDTKPTDCPGHHMSVASVRRMATQILAASDGNQDIHPRTASNLIQPGTDPGH